MLDISSVDLKTEPDARYNSVLFAKLIKKVMQDGKKATAEKIVYGAFEKLESMIKQKKVEVKVGGVVKEDIAGVDLLSLIVSKILTSVEVVEIRVGGVNYRVPKAMLKKRSVSLALALLVHYARLRREKTAIDKLAGEFTDILNDCAGSIKKKIEIEKNAEANRPFAHFLRT